MRCQGPPVVDRSTLLSEASDLGSAIFRRVADLEHSDPSDLQRLSLEGSPIQPFWINECDSLLFYEVQRRAFLAGSSTGCGFLIARLPSPHPTLIKWSAPCFITIHLTSFGLSLGKQTLQSFTACMNSTLRQLLSRHGTRNVSGLEASINCGGLQHKADLIAVPGSGSHDLHTIGINAINGGVLDLCFAWGSMQVDTAKNSAVYGPEVTPLAILHGGVQTPREMQPLFGQLSAVVHTVERVTPPARVSASLERYTAGFDPDRRMVLPNGRVIAEKVEDGAA